MPSSNRQSTVTVSSGSGAELSRSLKSAHEFSPDISSDARSSGILSGVPVAGSDHAPSTGGSAAPYTARTRTECASAASPVMTCLKLSSASLSGADISRPNPACHQRTR